MGVQLANLRIGAAVRTGQIADAISAWWAVQHIQRLVCFLVRQADHLRILEIASKQICQHRLVR